MKNQRFNPYRTIAAVALVSLALALAASGCTSKGTANTINKAAVSQPGTPVDVQVLKAETVKDEMEVSGTLMAKQSVSIMSELSRKVTDVYAKEGQHVSAGTILFKLDDADLRAQLEQLQQQEKLAKLNEQRLKDLINHQAVMQQDYDQVFTNLKVLEAQIKQIKVTIDKTAIRAPFNGRIGIVNIYRGALVSPGTSLTTIEDNSQVKVDFSIPEKYTSTVNIGDAIGFTVESTSKPYEARIIAREASVDNSTRSLLVRAVSDNPDKELLPGQSARLKVRLNTSANAIMVPNQALIPSSQGYSVFVASAGKATIKPVEIGQRDAYSVHILNGLKAGDTLIVSNMLRLIPGSQVQLVSIK